jgi:hypothetical protein
MADLWDAAYAGDIARVKALLAGGASINEANQHGVTALSYALGGGHYDLALFLFAEGGACIGNITHGLCTFWDMLHFGIYARRQAGIEETDADGLSALLKVMVMLDNAPQFFISSLTPLHAELYTRGRHLRAQLPSYLEQQRAMVVVHCPLPTVLQSLVAVYAATTPEDMWTDGLRVQAPQPKRPREAVVAGDEGKEEGEIPLRRSVRLRQKRG